MKLWLAPWKPFLPLMDMNQFFPLADTIPSLLLIVFVVILLALLVIYYILLVIRAWHDAKLKLPSKVTNHPHLGAPVAKQRHPRGPRQK